MNGILILDILATAAAGRVQPAGPGRVAASLQHCPGLAASAAVLSIMQAIDCDLLGHCQNIKENNMAAL